ncbi:hypothetical protein ECZC05_33130 [Escherichia coli]|uniref:hypothetical protein n=1 Tax=Escherichia coli TaxID=562 RepID=UPI0012FE2DAC|nr:hypothetical protein [Escherichia coli]MVV97917.1 hypothetical protein [Escherichia coli]MWP12266.1 hypothetical protein [Escherichia coli]GJH50204.1 hypothetical protein ECZC02_10170 [Escherichia coli]GJH68340.1 hypothetical protein ECZC05_33130 [Escherichia coli]GJH77607.1 hypothetical protein ECZC07_15290 [Escherichia coli]
MKIPTNLIPGFYESTRPVVVYRNKDGSFRSGFVMRDNEAVVNLSFLNEVSRLAGRSVDDFQKQL